MFFVGLLSADRVRFIATTDAFDGIGNTKTVAGHIVTIVGDTASALSNDTSGWGHRWMVQLVYLRQESNPAMPSGSSWSSFAALRRQWEARNPTQVHRFTTFGMSTNLAGDN